MMTVDKNGMIGHPRVIPMRRPAIEKGMLLKVSGLIIHQTGGKSAESALSSYLNAGANGAHILVDRNGTMYQTASLLRQTWHVGKLRSRCVAESRCTAAELRALRIFSPTAEHDREKKKAVPDRYPSNVDSIGIELVGAAQLDATAAAESWVFEAATIEQNLSLGWLVGELRSIFDFPSTEIFRHPVVSRKTPSEASTARW